MTSSVSALGLSGSPESSQRESAAAEGPEAQAALSTALVSVFRGRFCDLILPRHPSTAFGKDEVIYTLGDKQRTLFFLQRGFVKVGTITANGNELIYDVRRGGDVVGELCAAEAVRPDRAVALEETDAIVVPFEEVKSLLMTEPSLMAALIEVFCTALKQAYVQINTLALDDTIQRLARTLIGLAQKMGRPSGPLVEIPTYLTQEEIAQMIATRRERVSTALNVLRRRGVVQYTHRGKLLIDMEGLGSLSEGKAT